MLLGEQFLKSTITNVEVVGEAFCKGSFSADINTLERGDLFVVLGDQADEQSHIEEALLKGAVGVMVDRKLRDNAIALCKKHSAGTVIVDDTLQALVQLATAWRSQFDYPVVGITGSVGKTSTKKILAKILELENIPYTISSDVNNSKVNIALSILCMNDSHKVAIFEMGVTRRGEMAELAALVKPTYAVITSVGHSHMEGLGSLTDIALEKRTIFKYFTASSIGVVNGDNPMLGAIGYAHPVIKFGSKTINQVQARKIQVSNSRINFVLKIYKKKYSVSLEQIHEGAVFNSLAATVVAHLLGVEASSIIEGIQQPLSIEGRFEKRELSNGAGVLIHDCYTANPESMKASLLALENIETNGKKIAILGDMHGLGVNSPFWHRQMGRFLRKVPSLSHVILVGDMVQWTRKTLPVCLSVDRVANWEEALDKVRSRTQKEEGSVVLVKGSREVGLNHLVNRLSKMPEAA